MDPYLRCMMNWTLTCFNMLQLNMCWEKEHGNAMCHRYSSSLLLGIKVFRKWHSPFWVYGAVVQSFVATSKESLHHNLCPDTRRNTISAPFDGNGLVNIPCRNYLDYMLLANISSLHDVLIFFLYANGVKPLLSIAELLNPPIQIYLQCHMTPKTRLIKLRILKMERHKLIHGDHLLNIAGGKPFKPSTKMPFY